MLFSAVTEDARSLQCFVIAFGLKRHPGNSDRNSSIQTALSLFLSVSSLSHTHQAQFREEIPHTEATFNLVPAYLTHTHTHTQS